LGPIEQKAEAMAQVFEHYKPVLSKVEACMLEMFDSDVFIIPVIGRHLINSGGKRMRPLFLLMSAELAGYEGDDHLTLASIIESVHTASLLHDDVVDGAESRRGKPSANSLWGNQVVILVGDYLYSNALKVAVSFNNQRIMETLSAATTRMTLGELTQLQKSNSIEITEDEYFDIISSKTGALISAASRIGGILGKCSKEHEEALGTFGLMAGNAFQVVDDILDYKADEGALGKKLGKDLEEGKVTLPLIYLLRSANDDERGMVQEILDKDGVSEADLKRVLDLFKSYKAVDEAFERARKLVEDAKGELEIFPASKVRDRLFELSDYALIREK
jgi:octaprenyl-diphosphate synthase